MAAVVPLRLSVTPLHTITPTMEVKPSVSLVADTVVALMSLLETLVVDTVVVTMELVSTAVNKGKVSHQSFNVTI